MSVVLDSSAVLAFVYKETGHDSVLPLIEGSRISAANWSEVLQKIAGFGGDARRQATLLTALGIEVEPLTAEDALTAAQLYPATRQAGLSLGDRCCLALALRLGVAAVTADKAWGNLEIGAEITLIR